MSDAPRLPGWVGPVAAGAAALLFTSVVSGAIWTAGLGAGTGSTSDWSDGPSSSLRFTPDDADGLLLDGDDFTSVFGDPLYVEDRRGTPDLTYPEADIVPRHCGPILFLGIQIRGGTVVERSSSYEDRPRYQFMTQTAVFFDDSASAAAALDEYRTSLAECRDEFVGVETGIARYSFENVSDEFAFPGSLPSVTMHYYRGIATAENNWTRMVLMGNTIIVTRISAGADDSPYALSIEETLGGSGVFEIADARLVEAAQTQSS